MRKKREAPHYACDNLLKNFQDPDRNQDRRGQVSDAVILDI
jgi:hypothetical protein